MPYPPPPLAQHQPPVVALHRHTPFRPDLVVNAAAAEGEARAVQRPSRAA